eukprot:TRINITY_DN2904_c0_g1_i1.p1 TRINITY_DN2904_c0_g1~~TRINITY_DN2904_c0_g1_i1.p1  ORF type:complete len:662 (+),score=83.96 TRINITY_DN2904_c0_g1_i1:32-1987(+)
MASAPTGVSTAALDDVHSLLECGVPLGRLVAIRPHDLTEQQIQEIARTWVANSSSEQSNRYSLEVAGAVLERSTSALQTPGFSEKMLEGFESDAPEELKDPLFFTLMKDPVVLSSGIVVDRSTALNENGDLRFQYCPFTREPLKRHVYPLIFLRDRLLEFAKTRIEHIFSLIEKAWPKDRNTDSEVCNLHVAERAVELGCNFLKQVGRNTYVTEAQRMNNEKLRILEALETEDAASWMETFTELLALASLQQQPVPLQRDVMSKAEQKTRGMVERFLGRMPPEVENSEAWLKALCQLGARRCDDSSMALTYASVLNVSQLLMQAARRSKDEARLASARTTVYLAMKKNGCSDSELSSFLEGEGVATTAMENLMRPPSELRVARVTDRRSTEEWQHLGSLECGIAAVTKLQVSCEWKDQGWGNMKGKIEVRLCRNQNQIVCLSDVFGTCGEGGNRGQFDGVNRTFSSSDRLIASASPGDMFVFLYRVGGGGGHELYIRNFAASATLAPISADVSMEASSPIDLPPPWLSPFLGAFLANVNEVAYHDGDGDDILITLENGQLIKYVNGSRKSGSRDSSGIVTRIRWTRPLRIDDQYGWGGDVPNEQVLHQVANLADRAGIPHNIFQDGTSEYDSDSSPYEESDGTIGMEDDDN